MANNLQSWPDEAVELVEQILQHNQDIWSMLQTLKSEAVKRKNHRLFPILFPLINERSKAIETLCQSISRRFSPNRGRPPRWLEITLDSLANAKNLKTRSKQADEEIERQHWIVVAFLVDECMKYCQRIYHDMNEVELPKERLIGQMAIPSVFYEES